MLRIVAAKKYDSGNIVFPATAYRVGYLAQEPVFPQGLTPYGLPPPSGAVSDHTAGVGRRDVRIRRCCRSSGCTLPTLP